MALSCIHLLERYTPPRPSRVDRKAGIIYGVKVLGLTSSNGRRYTPECLKAAARLYEGKPVYCDHRDEKQTQRSSKDRLGKLFNVKFTPQGLYADLLVLQTHPMTARLYEAAEDPRKHDFWGLSHDAEGEVDTENGEQVVRSIVEVNSVDLVSQGATVQGLFESKIKRRKHKKTYKGRTGMKLKEWFSKAKLLPIARRRIKQLFEAGGMDEDMPMYEADMGMDMSSPEVSDEPVSAEPMGPTPDPADMDPTEALRQGFRAAFSAVFDDNTLDTKAKVARVKQLLTAAEDLLASGEEIPEAAAEVGAEPAEEPDGDEPKEDDLFEGEDGEDGSTKKAGATDITEEKCDEDDKPMKESKNLKARNSELEREIRIRDLLEAEGVKATPTLRRALHALPDDDSRRELIREHKDAGQSRRTRSGTAGNGRDMTTAQVSNTDDFVSAITRN